MWTRRNLPAVVADLHRGGESRAAVSRFAQDMIANLLPVHLAVDHIDRLTAIRESDAELAAFAKAVTYFIVSCQRFAINVHAHEVKLAWVWLVHTAVDPRDEQIAVRRDFDDREAAGVFYFIECARRRETAL